MTRCEWALTSEALLDYHDTEWGVPVYDDRKLFEFLVLDGFQAGLSWAIILNKREAFRNAFDDFNPEIIASYSEKKISELLVNPAIVRNKMKINAAVRNAQAYLDLMERVSSFSEYLWQFVDGKPLVHSYSGWSEIPAKSAESEKMSKSLQKDAFMFTGPTICYAFMQAAGMINDHVIDCFRRDEIISEY
ncbi:MAG: DNA-3-methyladenine glycosylase I [Candidatus Kapaibacterium sp.]